MARTKTTCPACGRGPRVVFGELCFECHVIERRVWEALEAALGSTIDSDQAPALGLRDDRVPDARGGVLRVHVVRFHDRN